MSPKTLLQMAGAPLTPSPPDKAALVLIDCQREYSEGGLKLSGIEAAVAEAAKLLSWARGRGVPVIHIVHHGKPGGALFNPEGPMAAIIPGLEPAAGEKVIAKALPNAFAGTGLQETLKATGRSELIIAGFQTHMCVSASVRAALDLGWRTTVVASAAGTRDLPNAVTGATLPAQAIHEATLSALADRFAIVVKDVGSLSA